jgi:hypothetical protein
MMEREANMILQEGKKIVASNKKVWEDVEYSVMLRANQDKFSQNLGARNFLLATGQNILAEASKYDGHWGIGFALEDDKKANRGAWGDNLLGQALMSVRQSIQDKLPKKQQLIHPAKLVVGMDTKEK